MIYRDVLVPEVNNSELPKPAAYYIDLHDPLLLNIQKIFSKCMEYNLKKNCRKSEHPQTKWQR